MLNDSYSDVLKQCRQLYKEGDTWAALSLVRDSLRRRHLDATRANTAGRFLQKTLQRMDCEPLCIHVLGQCTTEWVTSTLTAEAWAAGVATKVSHGGYDSIIQDLSSLPPSIDVLVLLPWHQRLFAETDRLPAERMEDELSTLRQAWSMVPPSVRVVQIGYDWILPGPMGHHLSSRREGPVCLIRETNERLREQLPEEYFFMDLEQISARLGRQTFYDPRNYVWTKQPFSMKGVYELSRHVWAGIRALTCGPKKVLILDLDNTLWGGIVGELGPHRIELGDSPDGEAFRSFQRFLKCLHLRGILLAVCSKNNLTDAQEPFEINRDMVLRLADFAGFEASWDPKPVAIQRIADALNLSMDSFVFFDDSPAEREAVRQQLPMVEVVEVPDDPAHFVAALEDGLWFEATDVTDADRRRSEQYGAEQRRNLARGTSRTLPEYLASLTMRADVVDIDDSNIKRVVQLLGKTNQFNLTTRRHTSDDVRRFITNDDSLAIGLRLVDRFGDYGLISVVLGERMDHTKHATLKLDTWLMSCRAIGRTVEHFLMNHVVARGKSMGYEFLLGEFRPTPKNSQVREFYPNAGFSLKASDAARSLFELRIDAFELCTTYVDHRS